MASNKRKPTPSVFNKANVMDEILSGAPPTVTITEKGIEQTSSNKAGDGTKAFEQATAFGTQPQSSELSEKLLPESERGQGSIVETKQQKKNGKSIPDNDSKLISGEQTSNGAKKNAETSEGRERNILPSPNKEHVDFLFSIDLVDKMEEVFPRLRRQMPPGKRRAFSKSVFVEMCVAEILWDFKQAGDTSLLNRMVKQFGEELSERYAEQRSDDRSG